MAQAPGDVPAAGAGGALDAPPQRRRVGGGEHQHPSLWATPGTTGGADGWGAGARAASGHRRPHGHASARASGGGETGASTTAAGTAGSVSVADKTRRHPRRTAKSAPTGASRPRQPRTSNRTSSKKASASRHGTSAAAVLFGAGAGAAAERKHTDAGAPVLRARSRQHRHWKQGLADGVATGPMRGERSASAGGRGAALAAGAATVAASSAGDGAAGVVSGTGRYQQRQPAHGSGQAAEVAVTPGHHIKHRQRHEVHIRQLEQRNRAAAAAREAGESRHERELRRREAGFHVYTRGANQERVQPEARAGPAGGTHNDRARVRRKARGFRKPAGHSGHNRDRKQGSGCVAVPCCAGCRGVPHCCVRVGFRFVAPMRAAAWRCARIPPRSGNTHTRCTSGPARCWA